MESGKRSDGHWERDGRLESEPKNCGCTNSVGKHRVSISQSWAVGLVAAAVAAGCLRCVGYIRMSEVINETIVLIEPTDQSVDATQFAK